MKCLSRLLLAAALLCSLLMAGTKPGHAQNMDPTTNPYGPPGVTATMPVLHVQDCNAYVTSYICNNNNYGVWVGIATYRIFGPILSSPTLAQLFDFLNDQQYFDSQSCYLCPHQCKCLSARAPWCWKCWDGICRSGDKDSCQDKDDCKFQTDVFTGCPIKYFPCSDYYGYFCELAGKQGRLIGGNIQCDPVADCDCDWDNWDDE